jgi:4a-hydroxytetrahydrobiopterin dehydratase
MLKAQAEKYMLAIPKWILFDDHIEKEYGFTKYLDGLEFACQLGRTAEEEDHHPDILVKWRKVRITLTTHAIKGLSENDFIMAAKAEEIYKKICLDSYTSLGKAENK